MIEAPGRLVQNQKLRLRQDRDTETQALTHSPRIAAHGTAGRVCEPDALEHNVDALPADTARRREEAQHLPPCQVFGKRHRLGQVAEL